MHKINYKAIRAFTKASEPLEDSFDQAMQADHAICPDGYATLYIEERYDKARHELAHRVGQRFGITANQLLEEINEAICRQDEHFFNQHKKDKFYIVANTEDGVTRYCGGGCWDYGSPRTLLFSRREHADEKAAELRIQLKGSDFYNIRVYPPIK
jgi:hypothetical protein